MVEVSSPRFVPLSIYHPHGFLPQLAEDGSTSSIIFDRKSYNQVMGDDSQPWRQRLLSVMRSKTWLLVGLSCDDDNLDSMFLKIKDAHSICNDGTLFWGVRFTTSSDTGASDAHEERRIFTKVVGDYDRSLPHILFQICQLAATHA